MPPVSEMTDLLPDEETTPRTEVLSEIVISGVTCFPPLEQATIVPRQQDGVEFTVILESPTEISSAKDFRPESSLWHNQNGDSEWEESPLQLVDQPAAIVFNAHADDRKIRRYWFAGTLSGTPKHGHVLNFTVKFRASASHDWRWAKDVTGAQDGSLHFQSRDYAKHSSYDFKHWFDDTSSDIQVQTEKPETDQTFLYSLTSTVKAAEGDNSGWQHHRLGRPSESIKWFSVVRLWAPWLAPRQGSGALKLDKDAILLSFLRSDGSNVVCLAISGVDDVLTTFFNDEHGNIIVKARNDRPEAGSSRVLVAVADSFEVANAAVMYHARKVVKTYAPTLADEQTLKLMNEGVKPEWLEEWYDGLAYCTWNGIGQKLSAQKIYDALDGLARENITITNLIIDDNWQSLSEAESQNQRGWQRFEANSEGFPDGMKATTAEIRKRHPKINHIAVWHAILGYWGGIDPNGWIAKNYKTVEVVKEPGAVEGKFTVVAAEDVNRMYDDFYSFLSSAGVDSVKTDAQFFLDLILKAPDRRALTTSYQDAWTVAHLRHFSSRAISCMSQLPQVMFYSQLPTNKPRLLVRNSDDFFPEIEASHPWHIFCNAHNSLFAQHLNVLPDWDMFQTVGDWSAYHAAARCVSGGPIYFTDYPGKHDFTLINQMTARTTRGKTVILRPHIIGKSMDPYNEYSSKTLLKIGTYVGFARTGTGILGIFNVTKSPLSELIALDAFPGTEQGDYVVGSFTSGLFSPPISRKSPVSTVAFVTLPEKGWDILTAYPLHHFALGPDPVSVAMLGLRGKMTGSAAVTGFTVYIEENGRLRIWVSLKALGVLGLYVSDLEKRSIDDEFMVLILGKPIPERVVQAKGKVLEIDIEKAWNDSGESPGWSNEIRVEIFINPKKQG